MYLFLKNVVTTVNQVSPKNTLKFKKDTRLNPSPGSPTPFNKSRELVNVGKKVVNDERYLVQ